VLKKILIIISLSIAIGFIAAGILSRKVPGIVVDILEKQLGKDISIGDIQYDFPLNLVIQDFVVSDPGKEAGANLFSVQKMDVRLSPRALFKKRIVVESAIFSKPVILIRHFHTHIEHALTPVTKNIQTPLSNDSTSMANELSAETDASTTAALPIEIQHLKIDSGVIRYVDYAIDLKGFVISLNDINLSASNYISDKPDQAIQYKITATLDQGRQTPGATIKADGSFRLSNYDANSNAGIKGLWLPYFEPYYRRITPSRIDDGEIEIQSTTTVENHNLISNARVNIRRLKFGQLEQGDQILGFEASSIFEILRDNAGQIALDLILRWDMNDINTSFEDALRKSIRHSIKSTFVLNLETVVSNTLNKLVSQGPDYVKKDWKNILGDDSVQDILGQFLKNIE
jgi:hypothetical protein